MLAAAQRWLNGKSADAGPFRADSADPWPAVDALIDRAPNLQALCAHRLHLLAARRWREQGRRVPAELVEFERAAVVTTVLAELVLERVRDAYDGRIILFKGYEVAQSYPSTSLRPFVDVDLLVEDADKAQAALLAAGFEALGEPELYEDIHHLRPLMAPGIPIPIELHHTPKWPERIGMKPALSELLARAVPSKTGIDGIEALGAVDHGVVLTAHAWAHEPLRTLVELLDVRLAVAGREAEARATAREWGLGGVMEATLATSSHIFAAEPLPLGLRLPARHLARAKERTVFESHLTEWMAPLWELQGRARFRQVGNAFLDDLRPRSGEGWRSKRRRMAAAVRHAGSARRVHEELLGEQAHVGATRARTEENRPHGSRLRD